MMEVYTKKNKEFHKNNTGLSGENNARTSLKNEDVVLIRNRKNKGEKRKAVYKDFQDKITFGSFTNIWYGYNWKGIA